MPKLHLTSTQHDRCTRKCICSLQEATSRSTLKSLMNFTDSKPQNPQNCSDVVQRIHISDEFLIFRQTVWVFVPGWMSAKPCQTCRHGMFRLKKTLQDRSQWSLNAALSSIRTARLAHLNFASMNKTRRGTKVDNPHPSAKSCWLNLELRRRTRRRTSN